MKSQDMKQFPVSSQNLQHFWSCPRTLIDSVAGSAPGGGCRGCYHHFAKEAEHCWVWHLFQVGKERNWWLVFSVFSSSRFKIFCQICFNVLAIFYPFLDLCKSVQDQVQDLHWNPAPCWIFLNFFCKPSKE